ncbi:MAG: hypothetical protein H6656_22085 [Ardenticatenaceae bacterium]|nr:hypothetical protein [Ardenticatenaceae bacterium]
MHLFGLGWVLLTIMLNRFLLMMLITISLAGCSRDLASERGLNHAATDQNTQITEGNTANSDTQKDSEEVILASPDNVIVVGSTDNYPENCSPREVAALVLRFFTAYNEGNQEQLASFFEPFLSVSGQTGWYSDTIMTEDVGSENDRRHFVTSDRGELLAYSANRYVQKEHLQLLSLSVSPPTSVTQVDVSYTYRRQGNDIEPGPNGVWRMGDGKGVIKCPSLKIGIWSMGTAALLEGEDYYLGACDGSRIIPGKTEIIVCGRQEIEEG